MPFGIVTISVAVIFAFVRINGRPIHYFLLNFIQTLKRPMMRVWSKAAYVAGLSETKSEIKEKKILKIEKQTISGSRLQDLSLVINTGGVYQPEEEILEAPAAKLNNSIINK